MYRSILVGQDDCDNSRKALDTAIWLAGVTRAHLCLIHLHGRKLPLVSPISADDAKALLAEREKVCTRAGVACSTKLVSGWTTQALVNETKWHDLVVVGKHGAAWAQGSGGLGSVATALLASSSVPVLVADDSDSLPHQLLVVFDESPDACAALRIAATM
ncbi:MAG: universal stress protein, partial [Candidatus Binatia bacterium]